MSTVLNVVVCLSLLSIGLFAGIMLALVVILQRQWDQLGKDRYVDTFRGFLLVAKGNPIVSVITFTSFLLPIGAGIFYLSNQNLLSGLMCLSAGLVFFSGCLLVTLRLNFPIYNEVIGWANQIEINNWQSVRTRFFRLNLIRLASAVLAFLLLAVTV